MTYLFYFVEAICAINLLVVVHEFGHLLAGKLFRVKVLRFSVGLGPRLMGFRFRGTDYFLAPFPVGGYVQLSQGDHHGPEETCMDCISAWKRMFIFFAGPFANLLFVMVIFWALYMGYGFQGKGTVVASVPPGSPAMHAGLKADDEIVGINGENVLFWSQVVKACKKSQGRLMTLDIVHSSTGVKDGISGSHDRLRLYPEEMAGVRPRENLVRHRLNPVLAFQWSWNNLSNLSALLFNSFKDLVTAKVPPSDLVGPVYLFHLSSKAAEISQISFVYLLAFISGSLFLFNLIPLPVLDGGQIVLAFLQRILKRPLGQKSMKLLTRASLFWLFLILASATLNDIVRLLAS